MGKKEKDWKKLVSNWILTPCPEKGLRKKKKRKEKQGGRGEQTGVGGGVRKTERKEKEEQEEEEGRRGMHIYYLTKQTFSFKPRNVPPSNETAALLWPFVRNCFQSFKTDRASRPLCLIYIYRIPIPECQKCRRHACAFIDRTTVQFLDVGYMTAEASLKVDGPESIWRRKQRWWLYI